MAIQLIRGFSLLETLISTALLSIIALSLVFSSLTLQRFKINSQSILAEQWLLRSRISNGNLDPHILLNENPNATMKKWIYKDTDNDGRDDTWELVNVYTPN